MMPLPGPQGRAVRLGPKTGLRRGSPACMRGVRRGVDAAGRARHMLVRAHVGGSISNISINRGLLVSAAHATSHPAIGVGDRRYQRRRRTWWR